VITMNKKTNKNNFKVEKVLTEDFDYDSDKEDRRDKWTKKKAKY
jgi:hypothetical protein